MRLAKSFDVVGLHCEGEIGNVIVGGVGPVPGETMLDKRKYLTEQRDWIRKLALQEPRGNVARNANIILPSNNPKADAGYVIMEAIEYPVMSGSNTICVATALLETGMIPAVEPVTNLVLESAAGLIPVECQVKDGKVTSVKFTNQPAFVYQLDAKVDVPGLGTFKVDVAWGGMCYIILPASDLGLKMDPEEGREIITIAERVKMAAAEQIEAVHPLFPEYPGITNCVLTGPATREGNVVTAKNTVVVSPGRIDRSPCGTGTSARMAVMHARGELKEGDTFIHKSIIDSTFICAIEGTTTVGDRPAIIPSVAGQAWITDFTKIVLDATDPYPTGFKIGDTWPKGLNIGL